MKQSKAMSLLESAINILVGLGVAMIANAIILPALGFPISLSQNAIIAVFMTVISLLRSFALRRLFEALHIRTPISPFVAAVIAERRRQIDQEGWSPEHDDREHNIGELAKAGAAYAEHAHRREVEGENGPALFWPWSYDWWKPVGFRRDLVKAAALIVAEGEKFDRGKSRRLPVTLPVPPTPDKGGHNDLSRWKQFGGTIEMPSPPKSSYPVAVDDR